MKKFHIRVVMRGSGMWAVARYRPNEKYPYLTYYCMPDGSIMCFSDSVRKRSYLDKLSKAPRRPWRHDYLIPTTT